MSDSKLRTKRSDEISAQKDAKILRLEKLLETHGICTKCGQAYSHDIVEPFASCHCNTSEWTGLTPYMELEKTIHSMKPDRYRIGTEGSR